MFLCRLGHRKRFSFCVCSSRSARTAGIRCPMNCLTRPRRLFFSTTFAADKLNFCLLPFPFVSLGRAALRSHGMGRVYPRHHHQHSPLVGLEAGGGFEKRLKMRHFLSKTAQNCPFLAPWNFYAQLVLDCSNKLLKIIYTGKSELFWVTFTLIVLKFYMRNCYI